MRPLFPVFLLLALWSPTASAQESPQPPAAELDAALADLDRAVDEVRTRAATDPGVARPAELLDLDREARSLRETAFDLPPAGADDFADAVRAQAEMIGRARARRTSIQRGAASGAAGRTWAS